MAAGTSRPLLLNLRAMFYMVTPNETSFAKLKHVPNFVDEAIPYFVVMVILECIVLKLQGKEIPRINDGINSMSHGLLSKMHALLSRSVELVVYFWLYENWHFVDLRWDNHWTWLIGFVAVDFLYYWFHRFSHESNIVWASHQVHHSSEDYNLTTALRQSLMQKYYSMLLNFPMAFFIPPSIFYVHQQFNLLYQFWIHTEVIHTLGPLEFILNTPSHHRVHHGRNPYCIDKNYGGTLIIWDRIFNTFEAEGEKVIYGLVHPNQFWNPIYGQFCYYLYIFGLVRSYKGLENKLSAIVKGPGWEPGKPWTGLLEDIPEVEQPVRKYNSDLPFWASLYVLCHFLLIIVCYGMLVPHKKQLTAAAAIGCVIYFVYSLTVFGALFENRKYSCLLEVMRCLLFLMIHCCIRGQLFTFEFSFASVLDIIFIVSALLWSSLTLLQYDFRYITKKQITDLPNATFILCESSTGEDDKPISSSDTQVPKQSSVVGRRLENLILKDDVNHRSAQQTNGAHTAGSPGSPPICESGMNSFFGNSTITAPSSIDPFGMEVFNPAAASTEQELMDIQAGFSRGLSFGTDDFSLDDLDPLNQK